MNKRQFTGFMFLLCTCTAFAQQVEVKKDSIGRAVFLPPEQKQPLNMDIFPSGILYSLALS